METPGRKRAIEVKSRSARVPSDHISGASADSGVQT